MPVHQVALTRQGIVIACQRVGRGPDPMPWAGGDAVPDPMPWAGGDAVPDPMPWAGGDVVPDPML
jgi:hypothetical protein